jgi:hypothetical protein
MALFLALTLFQHLIDGFRNHDLRQHVADLRGVSLTAYTSVQMTYALRRLRLKGLIYRPPGTNHYFVTPYGWKVARFFSRLDARVFRPAMATFTGNDAVLPFPLQRALDRTDAQLDTLIYQAFHYPRLLENLVLSERNHLYQTTRGLGDIESPHALAARDPDLITVQIGTHPQQ